MRSDIDARIADQAAQGQSQNTQRPKIAQPTMASATLLQAWPDVKERPGDMLLRHRFGDFADRHHAEMRLGLVRARTVDPILKSQSMIPSPMIRQAAMRTGIAVHESRRNQRQDDPAASG